MKEGKALGESEIQRNHGFFRPSNTKTQLCYAYYMNNQDMVNGLGLTILLRPNQN